MNIIEIKLNKYHHDKIKNKHYLFELKNKNNIIFFEDEFKKKKRIIESITNIKNESNITRIFARKCDIYELDTYLTNEFLEQNHLQGKDTSSVRLGLYLNDELLCVMTFGKSRFNKNYEYELIRFCTKLNTQVIGGFSRLETYFIRTREPKSIITFADKRFSNGNVYNVNGYTLLRESTPNYFYFKGNEKIRMSRNRFQKHKLHKCLKNFDPIKTEWENMRLNGFKRIYDLGNYCFVKEFK